MGNSISVPTEAPVQIIRRDTHPYTEGEVIGKGHFGTVHKATNRTTNEIVALKKLWKLDPQEVETLRRADHRNIVRLIDFFNDSDRTCIILEFCENGSLDNFLRIKNPLKRERIQLMKDMSMGLAYLHEIPIIHRDLKPGNILVDNNHVAKIADFGLARLLLPPGEEVNVDKIYLGTPGGTLVYMAPEVLDRHYNLQADIFSLGLVFCSTLNEQLKKEIESIYLCIKMSGDPTYRFTSPSCLDALMRKLITSMVERDYHDRPKAHDVHQQLLKYDPQKKSPDLSSIELVAAGIAECIGVKVLPPGEGAKLPGRPHVKKFTIKDFFHFTNPELMSSRNETCIEAEYIDILVKSIGGSTGVLGISNNATFLDLRKLIALNAHVPLNSIELVHRTCRTEDENKIRLEGIGQGSVVQVHNVGEDSRDIVYEMDKSLLDPGFNYNFTKLDDGDTQFFRGGHEYQRPCSWYRHAIKVKGQYDNDIWLGNNGIRTKSSSGEWPVSYHGPNMRNNILLDDSAMASTINDLQGVLTTRSLHTVAEKYAETFHFEGNTYQIALQNRVNPDTDNGHMVVKRGKGSDTSIEYWLSPKDDQEKGIYDVRPYGILIRLVDD